jgi:hypothetical protein
MPEYYREIRFAGINFGFYYSSRRHRYEISINHGEMYLDVTRKEGETIFGFLNVLKEHFEGSKNYSGPEESFDFQDDEELFEAAQVKVSSTSKEG